MAVGVDTTGTGVDTTGTEVDTAGTGVDTGGCVLAGENVGLHEDEIRRYFHICNSVCTCVCTCTAIPTHISAGHF